MVCEHQKAFYLKSNHFDFLFLLDLPELETVEFGSSAFYSSTTFEIESMLSNEIITRFTKSTIHNFLWKCI